MKVSPGANSRAVPKSANLKMYLTERGREEKGGREERKRREEEKRGREKGLNSFLNPKERK